ncbi:right-handed parallel beta-helix repeat-containing protein [Pseudomonas syringae]|nr:right-handed parallel beta-helix repeat-containing protein [Pseudomonas syringae]
MTVSSIDSVAEFTTNGVTTNFPFFFKFLANADLVVTYVDVLGSVSTLTYGTDYTVSGAGTESGGSIVTSPAKPTGKLIVSREMVPLQGTSLRNQGKFLAETHEDVFDRLTMLIQQGIAGLGRALKRPPGTAYFDAEGYKISNVGDPSLPHDAATLEWAQQYIAGILSTGQGPINNAANIVFTGPDGAAHSVQDLSNKINPVLGSALLGYAVANAFTGMNVHDHMASEILVSDFFPQYGGDALGITDCTAATQAAIDYALLSTSLAKTIAWPAGRFRYAVASVPLDPKLGGLTFRGRGREATQILFEEGTSLDGIGLRKNLFHNYESPGNKLSLAFCDMTFQGTWTSKGYLEGGGTPLFLAHYDEVVIQNCKFTDLSFMAMAMESHRQFRVTGCIVDKTARDGIRFRNCFNGYVGGNYLRNMGDDCIALHCNSAEGQIREGIVVEGNVIEGAPGIRVLSGRMVQIKNNIFRRPFGAAINVYSGGGFPTEANAGVFGVDITGNQIFDMLSPAPFTSVPQLAIAVFGVGKAGTQSGGIIPGQPNLSTGTFILPWNQRNGGYAGAASAVPAPYHVNICDNTVCRTLPAGVAYSAWGYGLAFSASGPLDPVMTDANMRPAVAIQVGSEVTDVIVARNNVSHVGACVAANIGASNFSLRNWMVCDNNFHDFASYGLTLGTPYTSGAPCDVSVVNNNFNGDPYHVSPTRTTGGAWNAASIPAGIDFNSYGGLKVTSNRFSNLSQVYNGLNPDAHFFSGNTVRAELVGLGFNTGNRGVGAIGVNRGPNAGFEIENYYCNPTLSSFGFPKSQTLQTATAQPSTGYYVAGTFVKSAGSSTIFGWYRLTHGTGHVPGTDWKAVALS